METNLAHGDSTGDHPIPSKSGNIYLLFMVAEDASYIHMELYQNREAHSLTKAYENALDFFAKYEAHPTYLRLDNEKSALFEGMVARRHVKLQYVPPGQKRANKSERAIRTGRNHYISGLATAHPDFPPDEWDRIKDHVETTLNLMRPARLNPKISAYEYLRGKFIWQNTPLGPPGASVMILNRANGASVRPKWDPHGQLGFYIGPAMEHRGCFQILVTKTSKPRVSDSLAWFPTPLAPPEPTKEEILAIAAEDLKSATKILSKSKLDLNEWGRLLASKIRKLDDYIHTYHPWMQKQDDEETQLLFEQLWEPLSEGESSAYLKDGPPPPT